MSSPNPAPTRLSDTEVIVTVVFGGLGILLVIILIYAIIRWHTRRVREERRQLEYYRSQAKLAPIASGRRMYYPESNDYIRHIYEHQAPQDPRPPTRGNRVDYFSQWWRPFVVDDERREQELQDQRHHQHQQPQQPQRQQYYRQSPPSRWPYH